MILSLGGIVSAVNLQRDTETSLDAKLTAVICSLYAQSGKDPPSGQEVELLTWFAGQFCVAKDQLLHFVYR